MYFLLVLVIVQQLCIGVGTVPSSTTSSPSTTWSPSTTSSPCQVYKWDCPCTIEVISSGCVLACENHDLDILPTCIFSQQWVTVRLSSNNLTRLEPGSFAELIHLEEIYLSDNKISVISENAFVGLRNLIQLDMSNNQLTAVNNGDFTDMPKLEKLYLNSNRITIIADGAFAELTNLRYLYLYSNDLRTVIGGPSTALTKLQVLYLHDNMIADIQPNVFGGFKELYKLKLSDNSIAYIDRDRFDALGRVTYLYLSNNRISTIPSDTFYDMTSLIALFLQGNVIQDLPIDVFAKTRDLEWLYLTSNSIRVLQSGLLKNLSRLKFLYLDANDINEIPDDFFVNLPLLEILDLSENAITSVNGEVFKGLKRVTSLCLDNNKIRNISPDALKDLHNLVTLKLSNNDISDIGKELFQHLASLEYLFIEDNRITHFSAETFYMLHNLKKLYITGNPFICTCDMKAFAQWIELRSDTLFTTEAFCADTSGLIQDLVHNDLCAEEFTLFRPSIQCEVCNGVKSHVECRKQNLSTSCNTDLPVCYSTTRYNGNQLTLSKGCSQDLECHRFAMQNKDTCYQSLQGMSCQFCCVSDLCNEGNIGFRTIELVFYATIKLDMQWTSALEDTQAAYYIEIEQDITTKVTSYLDFIPGVPSSFDFSVMAIGQPGVTVKLQIICTTIMGTEQSKIMEFIVVRLNYLTDQYGGQVTNVKDTDDCEDGKFGPTCYWNCSVNCKGLQCDRITGSCRDGCTPGWEGLDCIAKTGDPVTGIESQEATAKGGITLLLIIGAFVFVVLIASILFIISRKRRKAPIKKPETVELPVPPTSTTTVEYENKVAGETTGALSHDYEELKSTDVQINTYDSLDNYQDCFVKLSESPE